MLDERYLHDNAACARLELPDKWARCPTCLPRPYGYACPTCQGRQVVLSEKFQMMWEKIAASVIDR